MGEMEFPVVDGVSALWPTLKGAKSWSWRREGRSGGSITAQTVKDTGNQPARPTKPSPRNFAARERPMRFASSFLTWASVDAKPLLSEVVPMAMLICPFAMCYNLPMTKTEAAEEFCRSTQGAPFVEWLILLALIVAATALIAYISAWGLIPRPLPDSRRTLAQGW